MGMLAEISALWKEIRPSFLDDDPPPPRPRAASHECVNRELSPKVAADLYVELDGLKGSDGYFSGWRIDAARSALRSAFDTEDANSLSIASLYSFMGGLGQVNERIRRLESEPCPPAYYMERDGCYKVRSCERMLYSVEVCFTGAGTELSMRSKLRSWSAGNDADRQFVNFFRCPRTDVGLPILSR